MPAAKNIVFDFENKVRQSLKDCDISLTELEKSGKTLGIAVSGGED